MQNAFIFFSSFCLSSLRKDATLCPSLNYGGVGCEEINEKV